MVTGSDKEIKCPKCGHVWTPRVEQPKRCPRCGRWLVPAGEEGEKEQKTSEIKEVEKRDGRIVDFDQSKITDAIWSAAQAIGGRNKRMARRLSDKVVDYLEENIEKKVPHVEEIQDAVEKVLIENGHAKTAKAYILYRKQHEDMREIKSTFLEVEELVDDYLGQKSWRVKENSNVGYSMSGLYKHAAGSVVSNYTLDRIYPMEISDAHRNGDIHIHDLSFGIVGYCAGWSLSKLLKEGFNGVPGRVESKPPKHYDTALLQMANFIGTLQNEWAGAQAFNSMDTLLAPFVRKDDLSYKEVKQGMQKFVFNLNIASRWGGQTPFTNLTLDWNVPEDLKDDPVIYKGEMKDETYGDYQQEMDLINKAFLEVMMEGDMKGRPFTFPIPTYNVTDEFNWDSENAELLFQMTAQYGLPYFSNFVNSPNLDPSDIRSMCPIGGDEKVLIKSSRGRNLEYSKIRNIFEGNSKQEKYEIFSDGKFVRGRFDKYPNQEMIEVTLENNHSLKMTKKHLNFVMSERDGKIKELKGEELEEGMYLPYSLKEYEGRGGNWDLGYFVGAYAGDGSIDNGTVVFSLNKNQKDVAEDLASIAEKYFGAHSSTSEEKELLSLRIHSKAAVGLCEDYVSGKGREKHYRARVFDSSKEFREGVIQGHYDTDGGNRNRIYTSSEKMVESLNMVAATLGTTTSIYTDDREERLGKESNYAVLIYQLNREGYGELWFKHDEKLWIKIKSIEDISDNTAYCFEVENDEPMFTVGTTGILTHNCHLRLDQRELERNVTGGLFGSGDMTGSLGVVTINMPRLGYLSGSKEDFFERLDHKMVLAKNSLEIKRNVVRKNMENGLLPFSNRYLGTLRNHFSTIGLVGMNEACLNLFGKSIATQEGHDFSVEVLEYMRGRLQDFQEKTENIYNLEATPAEGTSYRLARIDKKKYPDIITVGKDTPYYTNSTQVPVGETDDVFEQIEVEEDLQTLYTGGTVFHTFLGERMSKEEARRLIKKLTHESKLPYITLTPTYSICPDHGYITGEHAECPECGKKTEVYSRVVGYYRPVQNWNDGKQEEFSERETFDKEQALAKA